MVVPGHRPNALPVVALWVVLCVFCNCAGWTLSAIHCLSAIGYGFAFLIGFAALAVWAKVTGRSLLQELYEAG
jgi:hypothetical protein